MRFRYRSRQVDPLPGEVGPQFVYEPVVVVRVVGPRGAWLIPGLVDTGGGESLIPYRLLDPLGLPVGDRFNLASVTGGVFSARVGVVDLELARDGTISQSVGFTTTRTRAIWGHAGFLNHFTATFDGRRKSVRLDPSDTFPPRLYA